MNVTLHVHLKPHGCLCRGRAHGGPESRLLALALTLLLLCQCAHARGATVAGASSAGPARSTSRAGRATAGASSAAGRLADGRVCRLHPFGALSSARRRTPRQLVLAHPQCRESDSRGTNAEFSDEIQVSGKTTGNQGAHCGCTSAAGFRIPERKIPQAPAYKVSRRLRRMPPLRSRCFTCSGKGASLVTPFKV